MNTSIVTLKYGTYGTHKHKVIYIKDSHEPDPFVNRFCFPSELSSIIEYYLEEGYDIKFDKNDIVKVYNQQEMEDLA